MELETAKEIPDGMRDYPIGYKPLYPAPKPTADILPIFIDAFGLDHRRGKLVVAFVRIINCLYRQAFLLVHTMYYNTLPSPCQPLSKKKTPVMQRAFFLIQAQMRRCKADSIYLFLR